MKDKMENRIQHSLDSVISEKGKSVNPLTAVVIAISISLIISIINLVLFIRSDMFEKVRLIQNPEQIIVNNESIDVSSPLTVEELNNIQIDINNKFNSIDNKDGNLANDLSESNIGF